MLSHASDYIRRKIDELFSETDRSALGALIYAPVRNLASRLRAAGEKDSWRRDTLQRMITVRHWATTSARMRRE